MYAKYVFYSLMFLVSFAVGQGALNENAYIKQFAFGAAFTAMTVVALVFPDRNKQTWIRITWGDIFVLALLTVYLFFHAGTCNVPDFSLPFVCFLFYGFIRIQAGDDPAETVRILSRIVSAVMLLHVLCCASQFFGMLPAFHGYFSAGGTFGNPDMSGAYLAVLSPFCYMNREWRIFKTVVLCLTVVLLLLMQARTALVAVAVAGTAYLLLSGQLSRKTFFRWALIPAMAVVAALVWWHPGSVAGRLFIWWIALNMLVSRPTGWGLYAFEKHYPEFQAEYVAGHDISAFFHPDAVHSPYNEFLNVGVTLGVGGLLPYLSFIVFVLIAAYRTRSPLLYPVCAFLVVSLSYFPFKIVPLAVVGIALSALIVGHCPVGRPATVGLKWKRWLLLAIIAPVAWLTWNSFRVYRQWQEAVTDRQRKLFIQFINLI
ncbi:MAG: O-antigen ligase family protein [Bacteroidales bacterium]|jgi:hypothetical protein|nr:O-antigen ligase family protein [Bacteroidales bacterium]